MKRILSLMFILSLVMGMVMLSACGETVVPTSGTDAVETTATTAATTVTMSATDFEYSFNKDGTLTITKYSGTEKNVAVPSEIDGKTVTKIGEYAFTGCDGVESVTMPPTVNGINKKAFFNAAGLKNINVSEENATFTSIDGVLFRTEKTKLLCYPMGRTEDNYEIPSGVVEIGEDAFGNASFLKNVVFCHDVKEIAAHAFVGCTLLESVTLYRSVASIEEDAFVGCSENLSIRGYKGSFAEEYALGNGLKFVPFSTVVIEGDRAPDE
ncbi:MAG: leucine-rich repeat domain-containing protein, partial [Clostridia bacterium]|nr:leucine-rich repeat domain-containing protein [Clostridia bacterium]